MKKTESEIDREPIPIADWPDLGFGPALEQARLELARRSKTKISFRAFGPRFGKSHNTYAGLERGVRHPSLEELHRMCELFFPHMDIVQGIRASYESCYGRRADDPYVFELPDRDRLIEDELKLQHDRVFRLYESGDVREAYRLSSGLWKGVAARRIVLPEAVRTGSIFARVASQAGDYGMAYRTALALGELASKGDDKTLAGRQALDEAIHRNRLTGKAGVQAAEAFKSVQMRIVALSGKSAPERDPDWRWIWNDVYRDMVVALLDQYGENEAAYLQSVMADYDRSAEAVAEGEHGEANSRLRDRLKAVTGDPDRALSDIETRPTGSLVGEIVFTNKSYALALHRAGDVEKAMDHVERLILDCERKQTFCRAAGLRQLLNGWKAKS